MVNLKVAVRMLERLGHRVNVAGNGVEAVGATARTQYAAVPVDRPMPGGDGYEATRSIRRLEACTARQVPRVDLTAAVMRGDEDEWLAAGMDAYLSKPVRLDQLAGVQEAWVGPTGVGGLGRSPARICAQPTQAVEADAVLSAQFPEQAR